MPGRDKIILALILMIFIGVGAYLGSSLFGKSPAEFVVEETKPNRSQAQNYEGKILCIEEGGEATGASDVCTRGIFTNDEKAYELSGADGFDVNTAVKGEGVRVLGVLKNQISPLGLDGTLNVFEIEKLQ